MPNSYHDAQGRFCSKGEMRAAIDNLAKTAKGPEALDEYFKLRQEYETAAKEPYTPTPVKKVRKDKPKVTFAGYGSSKTDMEKQALKRMEANAERQKKLNAQGVQITEDEFYDVTKNDDLIEIVTLFQQDGVTVTKEDVEILESRLKDAYGAGYDNAINVELGDGTETYFSSEEASQAAIDSTSFSEVIDRNDDERFVAMFNASYSDGYGNGAWDS